MAKASISATVDEDIIEKVEKSAKKENRTFSNMLETLIKEALAARGIK
jgi:hypothetical protein